MQIKDMLEQLLKAGKNLKLDEINETALAIYDAAYAAAVARAKNKIEVGPDALNTELELILAPVLESETQGGGRTLVEMKEMEKLMARWKIVELDECKLDNEYFVRSKLTRVKDYIIAYLQDHSADQEQLLGPKRPERAKGLGGVSFEDLESLDDQDGRQKIKLQAKLIGIKNTGRFAAEDQKEVKSALDHLTTRLDEQDSSTHSGNKQALSNQESATLVQLQLYHLALKQECRHYYAYLTLMLKRLEGAPNQQAFALAQAKQAAINELYKALTQEDKAVRPYKLVLLQLKNFQDLFRTKKELLETDRVPYETNLLNKMIRSLERTGYLSVGHSEGEKLNNIFDCLLKDNAYFTVGEINAAALAIYDKVFIRSKIAASEKNQGWFGADQFTPALVKILDEMMENSSGMRDLPCALIIELINRWKLEKIEDDDEDEVQGKLFRVRRLIGNELFPAFTFRKHQEENERVRRAIQMVLCQLENGKQQVPPNQQEQKSQQILLLQYQKKLALQQECQKYFVHLTEAIAAEDAKTKPNKQAQDLAIRKKHALAKMYVVLLTGEPVEDQLTHFKTLLKKNKRLFETRRASTEVAILNMIVKILADTAIYLFGLWKTEGGKIHDRMEAIQEANSAPAKNSQPKSSRR